MLSIKNISKHYSDRVGYRINLLKNISFTIAQKEFVTILAPVGSGKTSLLRILAGLDDPTSGEIINNLNRKRFIPTKPSSFPWLNVIENIGFNSVLNASEVQNIVTLVGLQGYENHYPNQRSEGFRFRISLGRSLASDPEIIIIDEPFNNLNTTTREEIYYLLRSIFEQLSIPIIFGTTNISEAIFLSDKIYLMKKNPGEIIEEINVEFPVERKVEIIHDQSFIGIRSKIENLFKDRADRQLYNFSI